MVYLANIPQATDVISSSQPKLLENFTQLNSQFSKEHQALTSGVGLHNYVTLQKSPVVVAGGDNSAISQQRSSANAPLFTFQTSSKAYTVPISIYVTNQSISAGSPSNLYDLINTGKFTTLAGTILCWTTSTPSEQAWATFVLLGGVVKFGQTQLFTAGAHVTGFKSSGSDGIIQVNVNANTHLDYVISGTPL